MLRALSQNLSRSAAGLAQPLRAASARPLSIAAVAKQPLNMQQYAAGFASGVAMFIGGRVISAYNKGGEDLDPRSQEFRDNAMNQGIYEAFAGGLEWGGCAWATLVALQVFEHFYAAKPIFLMMGAPRVAMLIGGSACAGLAIRGEEKLIGAARKRLIEQGNAEHGNRA